MSRVGELIKSLFIVIRGKLDTNKDGEIQVTEVLEAVPVGLIAPFDKGVVSANIPLLIQIIKNIQGTAKPKV